MNVALPSSFAGRPAPRCRHQAGVGLIEVLIAVLVLSIGFLGIAALQAVSLSTNNSAMARSMATVSAYSIMDAMRADSINAKSGAYNTTVQADSCAPASTSSSAATLASTQIHDWCTQLGNRLGASADTKGTVTCQANGDCTVTIQFDDSRAGLGGKNDQTVTTEGML